MNFALITKWCRQETIKGISHENGSIESPHGHIKRRIEQALIIRGNNNFDTIELYQSWLDTVVARS